MPTKRITQRSMAFVLAGGRGSRLKELTDRRVKPAVPFGGKARIIDFALSNDGEEHNAYAANFQGNTHYITSLRKGMKMPPLVQWSPDSRYILTHRVDERQVKPLYLLQSAPEDGTVRPKLFEYRYAMANEAQNPHFYHCARKIPHFSVSSSHPPAVPAFFPRTVPSSGSFGISTQNHFLLGYNTPYNGNVFYFSSFLLSLFDEENSVGYIKY